MEAANLWWERMFGPERTLEKLAQSYQRDSRSAVFLIPADVPYLPDLRELVKREWRVRNDDSRLEIIEFDCADAAGDFDGALLEKLAPQGTPLRRQGVSLADFIHGEKLLRGKALWITGADASTRDAALRLAHAYSRYGKPEDGFVLLELRHSLRPASLPERNQVTLSVGETDMETYATDLFRERYAEEAVRPCVYRYLSFLASSLCGTDAELAEQFAMRFDYRKDDPAATVRSIMEQEIFPEEWGSEVSEGEEAHPFSLLRSGEKEEIEKRIWRAQIRAVFPALEDIRWALIDKYREFWTDCLQELEVYGESSQGQRRISSPDDLELTQLNYCLHRVGDSSAVHPSDYGNIGFLPEQRNRLAHLYPLTPADIGRIFEIMEQYGIK